MDCLLEANGIFAMSLLKVLGEESSKNVFFSPLSISSAMAMVFLGAKATTAEQMAQVPGAPSEWRQPPAKLVPYVPNLRDSLGCQLHGLHRDLSSCSDEWVSGSEE